MATKGVRLMLGRRPKKESPAFGHVDVSDKGRTQLGSIVGNSATWVRERSAVDFHPEDTAEEGEVFTAQLQGFDEMFQPEAPWSLERLVTEIRAGGIPSTLSRKEVQDGRWTFYSIRAIIDGTDVVLVRALSPNHGLDSGSKVFTALVGHELKPIPNPLLSFDHHADVLVVGTNAFLLSPDHAERLFVDADAVKRRAPDLAKKFNTKLKARISGNTAVAIERVLSHNSLSGRRVERLLREGRLPEVTAAEVRRALPDAGMDTDAFGKSGALKAETDERAAALIDIAADLFYQPRFEKTPRRVASYRRIARRG
jgi:hypothetical protein